MGQSGVERTALANTGVANAQAGSAYGTVSPIYAQMAKNPQGLTPQQKALALASSSEALGGGVAAATGQGALLGARTGNAGAAAAAIDAANRTAGVTQSENAVGVENQSDQIAREQQRLGLAGLSGIYNDANATGEGYLRTADSASQAAGQRKLAWTKLGLQTAGALAGA